MRSEEQKSIENAARVANLNAFQKLMPKVKSAKQDNNEVEKNRMNKNEIELVDELDENQAGIDG